MVLLGLTLLASISSVVAQEPARPVPAEGVVESVTTRAEPVEDGAGAAGGLIQGPQTQTMLAVRLTTGPDAGSVVAVTTSSDPAQGAAFAPGDRLILERNPGPDGRPVYYVADRIRSFPLLVLFVGFVGLVLLVARVRGLASLIGMGISFVVIVGLLLPSISAGGDPIVASILSAALIIPVTFYLSHGVNRKTTASVVGTLLALSATGVLAHFAVAAADLTGFASEEASYLEVLHGSTIDVPGLLLASIVIGLLGILDDITISQSAVVFQLRQVSRSMSSVEMYRRAMDVGTDHIASLVNTLVLVYTSAALPLLLLFMDTPYSFGQVISFEVVAEQIVRILVASIGLILAVPATTVVAVAMANRMPDVGDPDVARGLTSGES